MLLSFLVAALIAASPVAYDSGSTIVTTTKTICMDRADFQYSVVGLTDRSSYAGIVEAQDTLLKSYQAQIATCSSIVSQKDVILKADSTRMSLALAQAAIARDSTTVAVKQSFWQGFRWGSGTVVAAEAVAILIILVKYAL